MKLLKNPVVLAIIVGSVVFIIMNYFNKPPPEDKKRKGNKRRKKNNDAGDTKETSIIIAVLAALVTWYGARCYFSEETVTENSPDVLETRLEPVDNTNVQNLQKAGGINGHLLKSSSDTVRSYQVLGSGLNIPKGELKIPNVMIDFK